MSEIAQGQRSESCGKAESFSDDGGAHGACVRAAHPWLGTDQRRTGTGGENEGAALGHGGEVSDVEDAFAVQLLGDGAVPTPVGDGGGLAVVVAGDAGEVSF